MPTDNPFQPNLRPLYFPRDLLRLLYWVYFRPYTLERYLRRLDPDLSLKSGLLTLWRRGKAQPLLRHVVALSLFHILVTPWLAFVTILGWRMVGVAVNWEDMTLGILMSMVFGGILGAVGSVGGGIVGGMVLSIVWGVMLGVVKIVPAVIVGVTLSMVVGIGLGAVGSMFEDTVLGAIGVPLMLFLAVLGGVFGKRAFWALVWGLAGGNGAVIGNVRLYEWPALALWSTGLTLLDWDGRRLHLAPPFWHEVIVLPLPGLRRHLRAAARRDRQAALQALAYLAAYRFGWARRLAREALTDLLLEDMARAGNTEALARLPDHLDWLPAQDAEEQQRLFAGLGRVVGLVQAARESDTAFNRAQRYAEAYQAVRRWREALAWRADKLAPCLLPILDNWAAILQEAAEQARRAEFLPNPYQPASPLRAASRVFKGRRSLFETLERALGDFGERQTALLLYGARRMGKTSTLYQFPARLGPQVVPLLVDLQGVGTVESTARLLEGVITDAVREAAESRGLSLPAPDAAAMQQDPFAAFQDWLDQAEQQAEEGITFLLALDEYEALERAIAEGRVDERVLELLRHMLQHRRRWLILLSGVFTLEDLPVRWSRNLINLQTLRVGPLTRAEAEELIYLRDLEDFRVRYAPEAVEVLYGETGGHPNWLQGALRTLVERLNRERRLEVSPEDARWAVAQVPARLMGDFDILWRRVAVVPPGAEEDEETLAAYQRVLAAVAREPGITAEALERLLPGQRRLIRRTLAFFTRRALMREEEGKYRFTIPLLARWLRAKADEEGV